jgi:tetratricopeptide (TPR) repeat protein
MAADPLDEAAHRWFMSAMAAGGEPGPPWPRMRRCASGWARSWGPTRLQLDAALDYGRCAEAAGRAAADGQALAAGLDGLKLACLCLGDTGGLRRVMAELDPLARSLGDQFRLQWIEFESAFLAVAAGDWAGARAAIEAAIVSNGRAGYPHCAAWYTANLGWLARLQGRDTEAIALGRRALGLTEQHEHGWWRAAASAMLGDTLLLAGERAEAIGLFERGLAAAREAGAEAYVMRCAAPLAAATGSRAVLAEAAGLLERAGLPAGGAWVLGYESYVSLARRWWRRASPTAPAACWPRCWPSRSGRRGRRSWPRSSAEPPLAVPVPVAARLQCRCNPSRQPCPDQPGSPGRRN